MKRYSIHVEFETPEEWGVGTVPGQPTGEGASNEEISTVLETVAELLRQNFDNAPDADGQLGPAVRYPPRIPEDL